jgi:hypothetical protein
MQISSVESYIEKKTGITKASVRHVLTAAAEYVSYSLIKTGKARLPYLGRFLTKRNEVRQGFKFIPSSLLRNSVKKNQQLERTKNKTEENDLILQKKEERAHSYIKRLQGLKRNAKEPANRVKLHLLSYLQNDFIWGQPWKHPLTKDVITATQVEEAMLQLKQLDRESYKIFFIIWMGIKDRRKKASQLGLTEARLYAKWMAAMDKLLILMLLPDLNSYTIELLNQEENGFRVTSPTKSSERNGVHRTTGDSHKVAGSSERKRDGCGESWGIGGSYWASQNLI